MTEKHELPPGIEVGTRQATPFTRTWYWAFAVMGLVILVSGFSPWEPSLATAHLPEVYHTILGSFIFVGALVCIVGTMARDRLDESWAYERTGTLICSAGWFSYTVATTLLAPSSWIDSLFPLAAGVSLVVRWISLRTRERIVRQAYNDAELP